MCCSYREDSLATPPSDQASPPTKPKTRKAEFISCFNCQSGREIKTAGAFGGPIRQDLIPGPFLMERWLRIKEAGVTAAPATLRVAGDRQIRASYQPDQVQFYDRSVVCTAALAVYLEYPSSLFLESQLDRVRNEAIYETKVFFIRNLGFITSTEARRITFGETLRFEEATKITKTEF